MAQLSYHRFLVEGYDTNFSFWTQHTGHQIHVYVLLREEAWN